MAYIFWDVFLLVQKQKQQQNNIMNWKTKTWDKIDGNRWYLKVRKKERDFFFLAVGYSF